MQEIEYKVWDMDQLVNKTIKISKSARTILDNNSRSFHTSASANTLYIKPLKAPASLAPKNFFTADIETMEYMGVQIPVLISYISKESYGYFLADVDNYSIHTASEIIMKKFFDYLFSTNYNKVIFFHNLGGFDGIFIYKYLVKTIDSSLIKCIIDEKNKLNL